MQHVDGPPVVGVLHGMTKRTTNPRRTMMPDRTWSTPKKCALEVFFLNEGKAYRSNATDVERRLVYWQSVDRLAAERLIEGVSPGGSFHYEWKLTADGFDECGRLWNVPVATIAKMKADLL